MRARHIAKQKQRARDAAGRYVVGRFIIVGTTCVLEAVEMKIGFYIDLNAPLTRDVRRFYRWRTRQGALQWLNRHPDPRCQLVNLERLPGREAEDDQGLVVDASMSIEKGTS